MTMSAILVGRAAESESESTGVGVGYSNFYYFLPSQDGNKDGNRTLRADCRRTRWFAVYGALNAGVAIVSG